MSFERECPLRPSPIENMCQMMKNGLIFFLKYAFKGAKKSKIGQGPIGGEKHAKFSE